MKLLWFHLMPYTELPDDFREKNPSVWVDIDSGLFDPRRAHHMYNDFMDELEFASQCGLDGVCVNEHHSERLRADALAEHHRGSTLARQHEGRRDRPAHGETASRSTTRPPASPRRSRCSTA